MNETYRKSKQPTRAPGLRKYKQLDLLLTTLFSTRCIHCRLLSLGLTILGNLVFVPLIGSYISVANHTHAVVAMWSQVSWWSVVTHRYSGMHAVALVFDCAFCLASLAND